MSVKHIYLGSVGNIHIFGTALPNDQTESMFADLVFELMIATELIRPGDIVCVWCCATKTCMMIQHETAQVKYSFAPDILQSTIQKILDLPRRDTFAFIEFPPARVGESTISVATLTSYLDSVSCDSVETIQYVFTSAPF